MKNKIIVILERIKSRFLAFWLVVALVLTLVLPGGIAQAALFPSTITVDEFCGDKTAILSWISSAIEENPDNPVVCASYYSNPYYYCVFQFPENTEFYYDSSTGYFYATSTLWEGKQTPANFDVAINATNQGPTSGNGYIVYQGSTYYRFGIGFNLGASYPDDINFFVSVPFLYDDDEVAANLDISEYLPDSRTFEIFKTDSYTPSDMIGIRVDTLAIYDAFSYITFNYTDSAGTWSSTIVDNNYYEVYYGDEVSLILIDPSLLSTFSYTLIGGTFYGSVSWCDYEFTCNIDFDLFDFDYSPPTQVNNFYTSTSSIEYNGGSVYGYTYFKSDTVDSLYWDDDLVLCQPFSYSLIALPILGSYGPTWSSGDFYSSFLSYYSSYYDVILIDVPETTFNALYGSGAYSDFQSNYSTSTMGAFISSVSTWYSAHPLQLSPLPFSDIDDLPLYTSNQMVGIAFSDHFFYKQIAYMLGDTSDILTEFSSRFFEEDGFSDKLFTSLKSFYDLQYNFSSNNLLFLNKLVYFCNYIDRENFLPDIVSNLIAANNYLGGLDLKLASSNLTLSSLDSNLLRTYYKVDDFNEFFTLTTQGTLDSISGGIWDVYDEIVNLNTSVEGLCTQLEVSLSPNIEVSLPDIDLTVLIEQYGEGIEPLFDFFQEWILIIPEFDYSDFSDWFDNAGSLVSSLADSNGNFVNDILDPYNYSDSGVSDFGWD